MGLTHLFFHDLGLLPTRQLSIMKWCQKGRVPLFEEKKKTMQAQILAQLHCHHASIVHDHFATSRSKNQGENTKKLKKKLSLHALF